MDFGYTRNSSLLAKKYREFFIPTILTAMALSMSISVDGLIVGNYLGTAALATVNLVIPVILFYNTCAVVVGMGASTIIAIAKGRRKDRYADEVFTVCCLLVLIISVLLTISQITFLEPISRLLTTDAVLLPLVQEFLQTLFYGTPFMLICLASVFSLRTDGKARLASAVLVIANMVNLGLDFIYIGVLGMGVNGAALATVTGYAVGVATLLFYVFAKTRTLHLDFQLLGQPFVMLQHAKHILAAGIPGGTNAMLVPPKLLCVNTIVLAVGGSSGMVILSVCNACLSLLNMFTYGASQTMTPIIGTLYGEKDFAGIRFVVKEALYILSVSSLIIMIFLELFPETVLYAFGVKDPAEIVMGAWAVRIFSLSLLGRSICLLIMFFCTATEQKKVASFISFVEGFGIVVPAAWLLGTWYGVTGVWFAFLLAEMLTLVMLALGYWYKKTRPGVVYHDILLLDTSSRHTAEILDLTIRNNIEDAVGLSEKIIAFLRQGNIDAVVSSRVGMVIEEMAVNIALYGHKHSKQQHYTDIRIKLLADEIIIILRDDGEWFDPTKHVDSEKQEEPYCIAGIELVAALAKKIEYARILGLNNTTITLQK